MANNFKITVCKEEEEEEEGGEGREKGREGRRVRRRKKGRKKQTVVAFCQGEELFLKKSFAT